LSLDARRLYMRLISRKGTLFRSDTLSFGEISDIEAAADELSEEGFLAQDEAGEPGEKVVLLTRAEILELVESQGTGSRGDLAKSALKTEFVVTDLGHVRYESYKIRKKDRLFRSRDVLEQTFRLIELNDVFYGNMQGRSVQEIDCNTLLELLEYLPERNTDDEDPNLRRMRDNRINRGQEPGDQLQINQKRWLKYFSRHGIPCGVIRVRWREQEVLLPAESDSILSCFNLDFSSLPGYVIFD